MMTTFANHKFTPSTNHQTVSESPSKTPVEPTNVDSTQIVTAIERGMLQVRRSSERYEVLVGPDVVMSFPDQPCVFTTGRNEVRVLTTQRSPVVIQAKSTRDADLIARTLRHSFFAC